MTARSNPLVWRVAGGVPWPHPMLLGGFAALLVILMLLVDRPLSQALREAEPGVRAVFVFFSDWGNSKWYVWPLGLATIVCWLQRKSHPERRRATAYGWAAGAFLYLFTAVAFSGIVTNLFKMLFGRARPKLLYRDDLYGFFPPGLEGSLQSFPSGHANTAFALAVAVALLWPRARVWLLALAVLMASARVGVNKHYLSDILAGAVVATATTFWLRQQFAGFGICFALDRNGNPRIKPEGRLLLRRGLRRNGRW